MARMATSTSRAPSMPQYFLGYAVVFGVVVGFALLLVLLMRVLR